MLDRRKRMNTQDERLPYGLFLDAVEQQVRKLVGKDFGVSRGSALKNNSVRLDTMVIRQKDETVVPNIFLNNYFNEYNDGRTILSIAREVVRLYFDNRNRIDVETIGDCSFERLHDRIYYKLVNAERNSRLLEELPNIPAGDLRLIFSCLIEHGNEGIASIRIDNSLAGRWNVDARKLLEQAMQNTMRLFPPRLFELKASNLDLILKSRISDDGIEDLLERSVTDNGRWFTDHEPKLFVLTNKEGVDGASCIMYPGLKEKIYRRLGCPYFIIPSSVHEVLILPDPGSTGTADERLLTGAGADENGNAYGFDEESLRQMVLEVNRTIVPEMDILSDGVYHFPGSFSTSEVFLAFKAQKF